MKQKTSSLFIVAMVLDFTSPKTQPLIQKQMQKNQARDQKSPLALYPLRVQAGKDETSTCVKTLEKFIPTEKLAEWSMNAKADEKAAFPIAQVFNKIQFDLEFDLHSIDQLVINAKIPKDKDPCGKDVCKAVSQLEQTLLKKGKTLRVYSTSPIDCPLLAISPILFEDENGKMTAASEKAFAALAKKSAVTKNSSGSTQKKVTKLAKKEKGNQEVVIQAAKAISAGAMVVSLPADDPVKDKSTLLDIQGPPFRMKLIQDGRPPLTVRAPAQVPMLEGKWTLKLISPTWLATLPEIKGEIVKASQSKIDIGAALSPHLMWVNSRNDDDQTIAFESDTNLPNILIPKGSGPIPLPKQATFRIIKGTLEE